MQREFDRGVDKSLPDQSEGGLARVIQMLENQGWNDEQMAQALLV